MLRRLAPAALTAVLIAAACGQSPPDSGIPIMLSRNKTHITVTVGNVRIPDIIIDSGMPFDGLMIYKPRFADSLDLDNAVQVRIAGAGEGGYSTALMLDSASFSIGGVRFRNQRLLMLQGDAFSDFPSNGIIGHSLFGHYAVEFNYDDSRMVLHDPDSISVDGSWTALPLYFKDNRIPWVDIAVVIDSAGSPLSLSAYIDFASGETVELLEREDTPFSVPKNAQERYLGRGLSGDIYGRTATVSSLVIGGHPLRNIQAAFAPAAVRSRQQDADAVIGNGALRYFNLIFDIHHSRLYIKPNHFYPVVSE